MKGDWPSIPSASHYKDQTKDKVVQQERLKEIVLVKAIEEADRSGKVISHADRQHATTEARAANDLPTSGSLDRIPPERLAKLLSDRASRLLQPVLARHSIFEDVLDSSRWPTLLLVVVIPVGLASGFGLRWLSDWDRINLMNRAIALLLLWNAVVYLAITAATVAGAIRRTSSPGFWASRAAKFLGRRLTPLASNTAKVDSVLGEAIGRFVSAWSTIAADSAGQHLRRVAHIGAACVGLGLVLGFYVHAFDHSFSAGWQSEYKPQTVKRIADATLRPFTAFVEVDYPSTIEGFEALQFRTERRIHIPALPWVNLLSLFILATVVIPRFALAILASVRIHRIERASHLPEILLGYAGSKLGVQGLGTKTPVYIFPYGYDAPPDLSARLANHTEREFGPTAAPKVEPTIPPGHEGEIEGRIEMASQSAGGLAILCLLRQRPRPKAHGVLLAKAHDRVLGPSIGMELKLVIDEVWPRPRGMPERVHRWRITQHRANWKQFATRYRVEISFMAP